MLFYNYPKKHNGDVHLGFLNELHSRSCLPTIQ